MFFVPRSYIWSGMSIILLCLFWIYPTCLSGNEQEPVQVELLQGTSAIGSNDSLLLGLRFTLKTGWRIYAPSPQGIPQLSYPPKISWKGSHNIRQIHIVWPTPQIFKKGQSLSYGYQDRIILPLSVDVIDLRKPVDLVLKTDYIACSDHLCWPLEKTFKRHIPVGSVDVHLTPEAPEILSYVGPPSSLLRDKRSPSLRPSFHVHSFGMIMIIAFLGGFILNGMPCVLPVLSLKIRSVIKYHHADAHFYRLNFIGTIFGILTCFSFFALAALLLKASGHAFGWGFHFQEPFFLAVMTLLMVLFASNLFGFFNMTLPVSLQTWISTLLGSRARHLRVFTEGYVSGIFATFLATPCTAPFLGTAIGYALSQGPLHIIILFLTLGLGFTGPYWLGLIVPLQKLPLPKPGPWMDQMSKGLGGALMVTALWLLWIFGAIKGWLAGTLLAGFLGGSVFLFYLARFRPLLRYGAIGCLIAALIVPNFILRSERLQEAKEPAEAILWKKFDVQAVNSFLQQGQVIFIDITAGWCLTCQLNKKMVLETSKVLTALTHPNVIALRGDITTKNPPLSHFMAHYGRHGIPFNIVYGPGAPSGILLPELLTVDEVLSALRKAHGPPA